MSRARIYICGGSGSGKSTLARQIGDATGLTVHDLDLIYRIGGGNGPLREANERDEMVSQVLDSDGWVVEGIHLSWTHGLLDAADSIIWLDHASWAKSSTRMVRRFVGGAFAEARRQRGWRRFLRFRDYQRHLRELASAIPRSRRYHQGSSAPSGDAGHESRTATEAALRPYWAKVVHCRTEADVEKAAASATARAAAAAG